MAVKTIKDVDEYIWREFRSLAARDNVKMGRLFEMMVEEYKKRRAKVRDEILKGKPGLSKKDADAMLKTVASLLKECGFPI